MYPNSVRKKEGLGFETSGFSTYRMITYDFIGDTMSTDYSYPPPQITLSYCRLWHSLICPYLPGYSTEHSKLDTLKPKLET